VPTASPVTRRHHLLIAIAALVTGLAVIVIGVTVVAG
jgi:hypothetical protein